MKKILKKINIKKTAVMMLLFLAWPAYTEISGWLWKVNETEYTSDAFKKDYEAFIELMAWQMGASTSVLKSYIGKGQSIEDEKSRLVIEQLSPEKFADSYLVISILYKNAKDSGYLDKPENKIKSDFVNQYIMAQMYLSEVMDKINIEIKDEDLEQAWVTERKKNPNLQSVPIEQGLVFIRQKMIREKREELKTAFIQNLKDKYKVKKNAEMDKLIKTIKFQ